MRDCDLTTRATELGEILLGRLRDMQSRHPVIGDVRGRGAMVAVELTDPGTVSPRPDLAAAVSGACHREGVLTLTCGTYGNVLRFLPPLVMPPALLEEALDVLDKAFSTVAVG